ncbi:hypothetical protein MSAN_02174400 [Mycena sanguinolenta]|uniref:DUF7143 domain-containing protein n=1 Tax=Mycena sanguinolenta TaxID=230812 RepID=A0A8H6XF67_9AGAR|nr:hypothetical protein MSAN_02174400 [Mycena sanguinolenta]
MFFRSLILVSFVATAIAIPLPSLLKRANACFVTGSVALPAEVAAGVPALEQAVTCNTKIQVAPGVPDITSGGIAYSTIDFQKSSLSPIGFALATFPTPTDPATADLTTLQNQLNDYLALEAGVRSQPDSSALLAKLKGPKFFLQFQIARVQTANGVTLDAADTVDHQLEKVTANAVGATASELAQVNALAKQV